MYTCVYMYTFVYMCLYDLIDVQTNDGYYAYAGRFCTWYTCKHTYMYKWFCTCAYTIWYILKQTTATMLMLPGSVYMIFICLYLHGYTCM